MTDIFTPEQRSHIMQQIKGKNTKPEMMVRKYLFARGFRYRINVKRLPGKPDIALRKYHTAIFIHGCFWHGHEGCKLYAHPKTNTAFWEAKIERNKARDLRVREQLKAMGWNTIVIWECQLRPVAKREETLENLVGLLDETFLQLHRAKTVTYRLPEEEVSMAAEGDQDNQ